MSKNTKIILAIGAGLVVTAVAYLLWKRWSEGQKKAAQAAPAAGTGAEKPADASKEVQGTLYELSGEDVANILAKEKNVVIMVYSPTCGHCHRMAPELEKAATMYHGCIWSRLNGAAFPQGVEQLKVNVSGFPTMIHYVNGVPVNVLVGYRPSDKLVEEVVAKSQ